FNETEYTAYEKESIMLDIETIKSYKVPFRNRSYSQATYVTSTSFPQGPGEYLFVYQRCCRIDGLANIDDGETVGTSTVLSINRYPGTYTTPCEEVDNQRPFPYLSICNNTGQLNVQVPVNSTLGDRVTYELAPLLDGGNKEGIGCDSPRPEDFCPPPYDTIPYANGYAFNAPFGENLDIRLDENTGILSGPLPPMGRYNFGVLVKEYDDQNVLIRQSNYDYHLEVADCQVSCEGDVFLQGQAEVDSFGRLGCYPVLGNLTIVGSDPQNSSNTLTSLESLMGLDSVYGNLSISNSLLMDVNGLENLRYVGGNLDIQLNHLVEELDGLRNLQTIGGQLVISINGSLQSLDGLQGLQGSIGGISLLSNNSLESMAGLSGLDSIQHDLELNNNENLSQSNGLQGWEYVGGDVRVEKNNFAQLDFLDPMSYIGGTLYIRNEDSLFVLNNANQLDTIGGALYLQENAHLQEVNGFNELRHIDSTLWLSIPLIRPRIDGFQQLKSVGHDIDIRADRLDTLRGLGQLERIEGRLYFADCWLLRSIHSFDQLRHVGGGIIFINAQRIEHINAFSQVESIGGNIGISEALQLKSFEGFESLDSVGSIWFRNNPLLEAIPSFPSLKKIKFDFRLQDNDQVNSYSGFDQLEQIGGNLSIADNDGLLSVNGFPKLYLIEGSLDLNFSEVLQSVNAFPNLAFIGSDLDISNNPALNDCDFLCHILENAQIQNDIDIDNNGPSCITGLDDCALALITGQVFLDQNQNGQRDAGERNLQYPTEYLSWTPAVVRSQSDATGTYSAFAEPEMYSLSASDNDLFGLTDEPIQFNLPTADSTYTRDLALYPKSPVLKAAAYIALPDRMRCETAVPVSIRIHNEGNVPFSGKVSLLLDSLTSYIDATDVPLEILGDSIVWAVTDIYPSYDAHIQLRIQAPAAQFLGDTMYFRTTVLDPQDNPVTHRRISSVVRCSYDPNDKQVDPARGGENYTLFEEDFLYTIRFENTGNDTAFRVEIRDVIDTSLNLASFQFIQASHPLTQYEINDGRQVTFTFEDIDLLATVEDSTRSMGYVQFRIVPNPGLAERTRIENTAAIFFDFNPPIITNTVVNTMVSELPMTTSVREPSVLSDIALFPNPYRQEVYLQASKPYSSLRIKVFDLQGKLHWESQMALGGTPHPLSLPEQSPGVLMIQLLDETSGESKVFKLIQQ
ncbi:MAG: hypothetical protein AAFV25_13425, partial [Bacteroidota bacterium]